MDVVPGISPSSSGLHNNPVTWPLKLTEAMPSYIYSSVQFSRSVVSDSLRPHESQHARPPCPSPTPGVHPNPCPLSQWCHSNISSSAIPFSSCAQSFPASGSFPMSQLFAWGGQSIGVSASTSVLPMNTQDWFSLGWTGWIYSQILSGKPEFLTLLWIIQFCGASQMALLLLLLSRFSRVRLCATP